MAIDATLEAVVKCTLPLSEFAWQYRYPGEAVDPTSPAAETALRLAADMLQAVLDRLPDCVRP